MGFPGNNTGAGCHFLLRGIQTNELRYSFWWSDDFPVIRVKVNVFGRETRGAVHSMWPHMGST